MKIMVSELSILMNASDYWRNTSKDNVYYANLSTRGKLSFSEDSEGAYASIKTCEDISTITTVDTPTFYVEWPSGKHNLFLPDSWETNAPLVGRPYVAYKWDCYRLAQDYYNRTHSVVLPDMEDDLRYIKDNWAETSFNGNAELTSNWDVVLNPQVNDAVFFAVGHESFLNKNPNHCGIFLENNMLLHHYIGRNSCIEPYDNWCQWTVNYVRNKNV
jgi:cell wall-associated NlpC family hydrolase